MYTEQELEEIIKQQKAIEEKLDKTLIEAVQQLNNDGDVKGFFKIIGQIVQVKDTNISKIQKSTKFSYDHLNKLFSGRADIGLTKFLLILKVLGYKLLIKKTRNKI